MMSSQMIRSRRLHKIDELTQLKNNYYRILHSLTPRGCLFWMSSTSENVLQLWICSPARPPSYNFSYIIYCLSTASYSFLFYVDDVICHFVTLLVYVRRCPQCSVLMKTLMLIRAPKNKLSRSSKTKKTITNGDTFVLCCVMPRPTALSSLSQSFHPSWGDLLPRQHVTPALDRRWFLQSFLCSFWANWTLILFCACDLKKK